MVKIFFCLVAILLISSAESRADSVLTGQVRSLPLQSLCGQNSYSKLPGNYTFNSIYRLKLIKDLQPLSYYARVDKLSLLNLRAFSKKIFHESLGLESH